MPASSSPHAGSLHPQAYAAGTSLVDAMVRLLHRSLDAPPETTGRRTLLAVCPNSEAVARAALLAAQEADTPLLYAATLNQVDRDGGYTGWTPAAFADFVAEQAERYAIDVPFVLGLDHGGPWKKDTHADRSYDATMAAVKRSIEACLDAGYALLHLDPTVDRRLPPNTPVPIDAIVARTVELLTHAEAYRKRRDLPPVAYEVGTEEVGGGLQSVQRFRDFLSALGAALDAHELPHPRFVVGDIGTKLDSAHVNTKRARQLTRVARRHGALIKGHYTDGVTDLDAYPRCGIGGANVGPGLAAAEYEALMDLVRLEQSLGPDAGLPDALRTAVVESGRWTKWRYPEEADLAFDELPPDRQQWFVETGSRYVWTHPDVQTARAQLYAHVAPYRNADAFVVWRVKQAILRYMHAFHLVGFNAWMTERLQSDGQRTKDDG